MVQYPKSKYIGESIPKIAPEGIGYRKEGGFDYAKLGLGIIIGPKNWEHARDLFRKVGFWDVGTRRHEVVIERPGGKAKEYDVFLMGTSKPHFSNYIRKGSLYPQHSHA